MKRINVAFVGGIKLEPLRYEQQRNIAVGIYATNWRDWYFVNERHNADPERDPQFYYDLAVKLMREKDLQP